MKYLEYRQVLWIYRRIIEETGGSPGIRDEGLLRSALARPKVSFGGQELYPTLFEKTTAFLESLVRNHPFVDGNKRTAWECFDVMLNMNGYRVTSTHQQNFELLQQIIGRGVTVQDVAEWLSKHTRR